MYIAIFKYEFGVDYQFNLELRSFLRPLLQPVSSPVYPSIFCMLIFVSCMNIYSNFSRCMQCKQFLLQAPRLFAVLYIAILYV